MDDKENGIVWRPRPEKVSRHGYLRFDKNERVTAFSEGLFSKLKDKITWNDICAYPETSSLYEILSIIHGVDQENIVLTAGSDGAIKVCFEAFSKKGEKVLFMSPTFAMVEVYCQCYGAIPYRINYDSNLEIDWDSVHQKGFDGVSLIILASPNSPTGTDISLERIELIVAQAKEENIPVLIDEAYFGFTKTTAVELIKKYDNLIISRTFSKAYGLAGLRVGYIVSSKAMATKLFGFRPMYEINQIAVIFAKYLLENPLIVENYLDACKLGGELVYLEMQKIGVKCILTKANFFHINLGKFGIEILKEFSNNKILVKEAAIPQLVGYIRISLGPKEEMQKIVDIIKRYY